MKISKKILAVILMLAVLTLPACGNNKGSEESAATEAANALDLSGSWMAETQGNDYYLAGFIKDGLIELHWVSSYDQNGSVYWAGTYKAPKEETNTYSWTSERDEAIMAKTTYGAPDATRQFSYQDGKLTLEAGEEGYAVVLIPSDTDYTGLAVQVTDEERKAAEKAKADKKKEEKKAKEEKEQQDGEAENGEETVSNVEAAKEEKVKNAKLVDSGYAVESVGNGVSMVYYGAEIANLNKYNAIKSPTIEITVRAKDGSLISKQKRTLEGIAPDTRVTFGDTLKCKNGEVDDVEIKVKNSDYDIVPYEGSGVFAADDIKVGGVEESIENEQAVYTGTVTNNTDYDIPGVLVSVVYFKEGKIVGGSTEQLESIPGKGKSEFTIQNRSAFSDYDDYEVHATIES